MLTRRGGSELGLVRRGIRGWPEVKPAKELAGTFLDRSPEAEDLGALVPAKPVPDHVGDRVTVDGFAVFDQGADRRVAVKREYDVDVRHREPAQHHPLGLEEHIHASGSHGSATRGSDSWRVANGRPPEVTDRPMAIGDRSPIRLPTHRRPTSRDVKYTKYLTYVVWRRTIE